MKMVRLPLKFIEVVRKEGAIFKVLWWDWICDYADKVLDSDFCDNYNCPYKGVERWRVREIWSLGVAHLKDGLIISETEPEPEQKQGRGDDSDFVTSVIAYLNSKSGAKYKPDNRKNRELVLARRREGFELDDFYKVIDKKVAQWRGTEMEKYLRPITLFSLTKFENYVNEPETIHSSGKQSVFSRFQENADKAKRLFKDGGH